MEHDFWHTRKSIILTHTMYCCYCHKYDSHMHAIYTPSILYEVLHIKWRPCFGLILLIWPWHWTG